jgi:hypothetical protein
LTDAVYEDRKNITIAPDTHIIQSSAMLGLVDPEDIKLANVNKIVAELWNTILERTDKCAIDIHTPLWLWSRNNFEIKNDDLQRMMELKQDHH